LGTSIGTGGDPPTPWSRGPGAAHQQLTSAARRGEHVLPTPRARFATRRRRRRRPRRRRRRGVTVAASASRGSCEPRHQHELVPPLLGPCDDHTAWRDAEGARAATTRDSRPANTSETPTPGLCSDRRPAPLPISRPPASPWAQHSLRRLALQQFFRLPVGTLPQKRPRRVSSHDLRMAARRARRP
jgi:hypothetical protein